MNIERNLGEQPIMQIMVKHNLKAHDLVASISALQLTHKMIARGCKGRRLTPNVKAKILDALNKCSGLKYSMAALFTY